MNIYCVGRNYRLHIQELGHEAPQEPLFFMKPSHALVPADGSTIHYPGNQGELHYEAEWVVRIKDYQEGLPIEDILDGWAIGLDMTLRDVQKKAIEKGDPWLLSKGFPCSAVVTSFRPFPLKGEAFMLAKNGVTVQHGKLSDMIFGVTELVHYCAKHFGLGAGDLIFTGTPAGVGPVNDGDRLSLFWGEKLLGDIKVALV